MAFPSVFFEKMVFLWKVLVVVVVVVVVPGPRHVCLFGM
jgi:hypothetical protein